MKEYDTLQNSYSDSQQKNVNICNCFTSGIWPRGGRMSKLEMGYCLYCLQTHETWQMASVVISMCRGLLQIASESLPYGGL